jgi:hypothetical protein
MWPLYNIVSAGPVLLPNEHPRPFQSIPNEETIMKNLILVASLLAVAMTAPAMAADVGVSINIGQPNFYGRIDIGDYPSPRVIYEQPVIVERPRHDRDQRPIYLRVPPGHQKNWSKHCRRYDACGQRVYFVQDTWYRDDYAPRYRAQHEQRRDDKWEKHAEKQEEKRDKQEEKRDKHAEKHEEKRDKHNEKHDKHDERRGERGNGH